MDSKQLQNWKLKSQIYYLIKVKNWVSFPTLHTRKHQIEHKFQNSQNYEQSHESIPLSMLKKSDKFHIHPTQYRQIKDMNFKTKIKQRERNRSKLWFIIEKKHGSKIISMRSNQNQKRKPKTEEDFDKHYLFTKEEKGLWRVRFERAIWLWSSICESVKFDPLRSEPSVGLPWRDRVAYFKWILRLGVSGYLREN